MSSSGGKKLNSEPKDQAQKKMLCMRKLKEFAATDIPKDHPLRDVLLMEKDFLTPEEFIAKLEIWMHLMDEKRRFVWRILGTTEKKRGGHSENG